MNYEKRSYFYILMYEFFILVYEFLRIWCSKKFCFWYYSYCKLFEVVYVLLKVKKCNIDFRSIEVNIFCMFFKIRYFRVEKLIINFLKFLLVFFLFFILVNKSLEFGFLFFDKFLVILFNFKDFLFFENVFFGILYVLCK